VSGTKGKSRTKSKILLAILAGPYWRSSEDGDRSGANRSLQL